MNFDMDIVFRPKSFYGVELSGIVGVMVQDIKILCFEPNQYEVKITWVAPQIDTGQMVTLDLSGYVRFDDEVRPAFNGHALTDEQTIVRHLVRFAINHEIDEGILLDGVPLDEPQHAMDNTTFEWPGAVFSLS